MTCLPRSLASKWPSQGSTSEGSIHSAQALNPALFLGGGDFYAPGPSHLLLSACLLFGNFPVKRDNRQQRLANLFGGVSGKPDILKPRVEYFWGLPSFCVLATFS